MSGAFIATMAVAAQASATFVSSSILNNGADTAGQSVTYSVPAGTRLGDLVLFFCLANSAGQNSFPPGTGWTSANGSLPANNIFSAKIMATNSDLTTTRTANGGYIAFVVYRNAPAFGVVSGTGFIRSPYHKGVAFCGLSKPAPASQRLGLSSNGNPNYAVISDMLPPNTYTDNTNYNQFSAVEFRSQ